MQAYMLTMLTHGYARMLQVLAKIHEEKDAQGTTEYAILVGVLVVIAIVAILSFKDKVTQLWDAIAQGINSL
ncbi:hypothetical protein [Atopobium fossor]|uniref:hypothetical protein n=1 Tax=Atopobium fossor TaxID=39487 RepID=UPI0004216215|nr:hypothetical protein [Atopobium fossor]